MELLKKGKYNLETNLLTTPRARLSFAALHDPREDFNGDIKYQATFIFDPDDVDLSLMRKIAQKTLRARHPKGKFDFDELFRDGDEKEETDGYAGNIFVSTKAKPERPPLILDQKLRAIAKTDNPGIASGDYVLGLLKPFAWKLKAGVSFELIGVQLVEHGERFAIGNLSTDEIMQRGLLSELPCEIEAYDDDDDDDDGLLGTSETPDLL